MVIFKEIAGLRGYLDNARKSSSKVGFVPTMGALHEGHLSLVQHAKKNSDLIVCSIFLNPTQFNNPEDFSKYPVSIDNDIHLLLEAECDILFLPSTDEIYPNGPENMQVFDFGYLETVLEGAQRPGHFRGVGQVVARLLNIVDPNVLLLGQKDYQQCMVIQKLKEILQLDHLEVVIAPTVRESDGLAMSSRNRRLSERERSLAAVLYQCLLTIQEKKSRFSFDVVRKDCIDLLGKNSFLTEYVALADASNLQILSEYDDDRQMIALIAAKTGEIRLIDNLLL